jgi:predicted pyridoxine 5'-phosphate oxidase superfamily flavin-nucleotide-binding protein
MSRIYRDSHREFQRRFDTERLADRIEERLHCERITDEDRAFIERMDMLFLATADREGRPNCSYIRLALVHRPLQPEAS